MIVVGSVRSGGATTVAMAVAAWIDHALLVEADPDGGVLALRYRLSREPGLLTLAAAGGVDGQTALAHAQQLPGGLPVVVSPDSPDRATHLIRTAGASLGAVLARLDGVTVVVDAGRLSPSSPSLCFTPFSTVTLIVARPRADELVSGTERVRTLTASGTNAALALSGAGPYTAAEVTKEFNCPVLGVIENDPRAALALSDGGSAGGLARSDLVRSARSLAEAVTRLSPSTPKADELIANGRAEVLS